MFKLNQLKNALVFSVFGAMTSMVSCGLLEADELACSSISTEPLTSENLEVRTAAYYREAVGATVDYFPGDCIEFAPQANWNYSGEAEFTEKPGISNTFIIKSSGTLCAEVTAASVVSEQICKSVTVYDQNVWGVYHEKFPTGENLHQVTLSISGDVYSGFVLTNQWFKFDTTTFTWEEKTGLTNLIDFTSYAGFSIGEKGYIVGNNSQYYSYNPQSNTWTDLGTFPENVSNMLGLGDFVNKTEFKLPVIGLAADGIGYFGMGLNQTWYAYNPVSNIWTKLANRPERGVIGDHAFYLNNQIHHGRYIYDIANDSWRSGFTSFSVDGGYSPGFVFFDEHLYGGSSSQTIIHKDGGFQPLGSTEDFNFSRAPTKTFGNSAVTGRYWIMPCPMGKEQLTDYLLYYVK